MTVSIGTVSQDSGNSGNWSWSLNTTDGPDQSQVVEVTATDSDGDSSTTSFELIVNNVAPSVSADDDPVSVIEGATATNTGSFSDPGDDDVAITASIGTISQNPNTGNSGTWDWSIDTTGLPNGTQTVIVTATDSDNASSTTSFVLEILNDPPQIEADADEVEVDEGDQATNGGSFLDVGGDDVTITVSVGIVTQDSGSSGNWSWSFDTTDGPDESQTVEVTATDTDGGTSTTSFELIVNNVAPTVDADESSVAVDEGDEATNSGSFSDPGDDIVDITASVGSIAKVGINNGTWSWSFDTTDGPDQSQTVIITATDSDGASSTTSFELIVDNVAPSVDVDNPSVAVDEGDEATNNGSFSDPGDDVVTVSASVGTITQDSGNSGDWSWSFGTTGWTGPVPDRDCHRHR